MQSQIYLPKLSLINKWIIILSSSVFILDFLLSKTLSMTIGSLLGLSASTFFSGQIFNLITYPFYSNSLMEVILNSLMLWLMGSEFEANWGIKRYLTFLFTAIIGGALLFLIITSLFFQGSAVYTYPLAGLSGVVSSLCLAYAVIYPERLFSFLMIIPVKAKYFCMILIVISLYQGVASPLGVGAWGQLGAIMFAYIYMILVSQKKFKSLSESIFKMTQMQSKRKSKAKLSIVKDDDQKPPKYWQ